jgi:cobalt-zinc-cadmium efflux system outer membrane protein
VTQDEQNLIGAVQQVRTARAALNVLLGRSPDIPVDASDALDYTPITVPSEQTLMTVANVDRPEIGSGEAGVDAARANIGLQKSQYVPDVTLGRLVSDGPVEFGFIVPIDLGSIHGSVDKAQADAKVQEAELAETRLGVAEDVRNGVLAVEQARKSVELYQSGVLPQTQDLLDRVTKGFTLGSSTILDVIDAQQTYRATRNSYITALGAYDQAVDQLSRAVGCDIRTVKAIGS